MKGSYVLLIEVENPLKIRIGKKGSVRFAKGFYAYVGSAMNGLEKRIQRHMGSGKRLFWHIDYLLEKADVIEVFQIESSERLECIIAKKLSEGFREMPGFGCSDCRCESHLFYSADRNKLSEAVTVSLRDRCAVRVR
jgi:Uri superfamily endonuclease